MIPHPLIFIEIRHMFLPKLIPREIDVRRNLIE
jgi:hypothetical protein